MTSLKEMLRPHLQKQVKAEPKLSPIEKTGEALCRINRMLTVASWLLVDLFMQKRNSQKQVKAEPKVNPIETARQVIRRVNRGLAVANFLLPVGILVLISRQHHASQGSK